MTVDEMLARILVLAKAKAAPDGTPSKDGKRIKHQGKWVSRKKYAELGGSPQGTLPTTDAPASAKRSKAKTPAKAKDDWVADWLDAGRQKYDHDAARAYGRHRELLQMAERETDPKKAKSFRDAAAAFGMVGHAFGQAHAARVAGDHEHADRLGRYANEVNGHVTFDVHRAARDAADKSIRERHGRADVAAGANLSPEAEARAKIEAVVGPPPKAPRQPQATGPLVHAASPRRRSKGA